MNHHKSQQKKVNFNLSKFYQDLQRVQSSLGKTDNKKVGNSPIYKNNGITRLQDKNKALNSYKKELSKKQLTKTKINLDMPYERIKYNYRQKMDNDMTNEIRLSDHSNCIEKDSYDNTKNRLINSSKDSMKQRNIRYDKQEMYFSNQISHHQDLPNKSYNFLEKTMETPFNQRLQAQQIQKELHQKLLYEITKKNKVYVKVQNGLQQSQSNSNRFKKIDTSLRLQQHFRQHRLMSKIIQEFKRICNLQVQDLNQLHGFLADQNTKSRIKQDFSNNSQQYF